MKSSIILLTVLASCLLPAVASAKDGMRLTAAYMCEQVYESGPENRAVIFSAADGKVYCFCSFDYVPEKTTVYHAWYHGDRLVNKRRLSLEPPGWKVASSMQLRESDKGPWRVEIIDADNRRLDTLCFSVTD